MCDTDKNVHCSNYILRKFLVINNNSKSFSKINDDGFWKSKGLSTKIIYRASFINTIVLKLIRVPKK